MIEFEILARGPYRSDQVVIDYNPSLRMSTSPELQTWMDYLWQQKLVKAREQNVPLFDTPLFRLIQATQQEAPKKGVSQLHLLLGDTSYKEYVTTRVPEFVQIHPRAERGNALAVCSVVETNDNSILLDKRQGVDVYIGRYHVIGGFFERKLDTELVTAKPDPFRAIQREIREETGIQASDILEQYILGVVYDLTTPHGEICFLTRLNISLDEVLYKRIPEENEIKKLHSLEATATKLYSFIENNHGNISATGEPNLLLYGAWKFGEAWFEAAMRTIRDQ